MKKHISILLAIALILSLAACGTSNDVPPKESGNEPVVIPENAEKPVDTDKPEETPEPTPEPPTDKLEAFSKTATIEETVMVDESNVRITATGLTYNNYAVELELTIENNSDKDLSFTSGSMGYSCNSVNGMMVADGYLNCDVAAGKKAMDTISLSYDALQLYGIQEIADIEIGFYTTDDDYNHTYFTPRQVTTSAYENHDYGWLSYQETITGAAAQNTFDYEIPFFATDKLYEQDGIVVVSQVLIKNADGEFSLLVELENQTQDLRIVSVSDIFINDLLVEGSRWSSDTIAPGKREVMDIELSSVLDERYWELYGIEDVGSVGFALQQSDIEWNALTEPEPVVISISGAGTIDMSGEELYNQNGIRIVAKTVLGPASEYDSYFNVLLLAENTANDTMKLEIPFNVMSINGFMVDYYGKTWELQPGQCALMEIQLFDSDLEEIKVTEADQITQMEFALEIKQGKTLIDAPTITMVCD